MKRGFRITALLSGLIVAITLILSISFISAEHEHNCSGDDCPICHEIQLCISNINNMGYAAAAIMITVLLYTAIYKLTEIAFCYERSITLVSLKVKLSN